MNFKVSQQNMVVSLMENERTLQILVDYLNRLGITVKYDRGNFKGGLVRYHNDSCFYLNRRIETSVKINLIIEELKQMQIEDEDIPPEIKKILVFNERN